LLDATLYWLFWTRTGTPLLAALLATDSIIRRRDTFYDRFAGRRVPRRKSAIVAMAAVAPPSRSCQSAAQPRSRASRRR
jgi:hypothetical protein